ncbi:hypothetical protein CQA57_01280 [Helicobacter anseris]|uniref:Uncharacterized protein n=1 Tax=Helicobacter anseris TaxID=375926 RepID=A0A3D8JAB6_9HELI|nr:hypothetical protein [Helicobacter anseris]RDU74372.1 hypothetical protein CQA57_01280 [Helicobacter anseris]
MNFNLIFADQTLFDIEKESIPEVLEWKNIAMDTKDRKELLELDNVDKIISLVKKYCDIELNSYIQEQE